MVPGITAERGEVRMQGNTDYLDHDPSAPSNCRLDDISQCEMRALGGMQHRSPLHK